MIDSIGKARKAPDTVKTNLEELEENIYDRLSKGGEEQHNGVIEISINVLRPAYETILGTNAADAGLGLLNAVGEAPKQIDGRVPDESDENRFYNGSQYNGLSGAAFANG